VPTNLPPEAKAKWLKVMEARTTEEKIQALQEFISSVPKHKGTEKLLHWARRRLRELREELEEEKRRKQGRRGPVFFVKKDGAAQVVLLGEPDSGKTALFRALTGAAADESDVPFATKAPRPGMLFVSDIPLQLVDTPSVVFSGEEPEWAGKVYGLARNADALLLVVDLTKDATGQLASALQKLEERGILVRKPKARVELERASSGGLNVVLHGKLVGCSVEDVKNLLREYKIYHAIVKIYGEASLDDVEDAIFGSKVYKPAVVVASKLDAPAARERLEELLKTSPADIPVIPASAKTGEGLELIGKKIVELLDLIRVYTKQPKGEPSSKPLILRRGATVLDVAKSIHSDLASKFKYARVWGKSVKFPGERVGPNHALEDGDVVEIHAS